MLFRSFSVLSQIRPFSGTRGNCFWILARILPFPSTRPDSIIFRYSNIFDPFPVLVGTTFGYSHGFYHFPVLARILPFFGTHTDATLFRYSSGQFFATRTIVPFPDTRSDSTFFRYSHRFDPFPVLVGIVFGYSHGFYIFPVLVGMPPFFGTPTDSTLFPYSSRQFFG